MRLPNTFLLVFSLLGPGANAAPSTPPKAAPAAPAPDAPKTSPLQSSCEWHRKPLAAWHTYELGLSLKNAGDADAVRGGLKRLKCSVMQLKVDPPAWDAGQYKFSFRSMLTRRCKPDMVEVAVRGAAHIGLSCKEQEPVVHLTPAPTPFDYLRPDWLDEE